MSAENRSGLLRALRVLELIAGRSPEALGVSVVARDLDMPKAVAHRILKEFTAATFLTFDDESKLYRLGPAALTLGLAALRDLDVPRIARPHLDRLVSATGETATLSVLSGLSRVYVDQVLSPHEIRMSISLGTSHPLHAGSSSKAILAHLNDPDIDQYLAGHVLESVTATTITDEEQLRAELKRIREVGYATSMGERQAGASSIAAPIYRANGDVFASVSVCGPRDRFTPEVIEGYVRLVTKTAAEISAELGYKQEEEVV